MIPQYLSALWPTLAPMLGNHLWQSTLFAITAGLLTLILRKNYARSRYWLWLAASFKFLLPFSLLIGLGSHLPWSRGSTESNAGFYFAMEEISQPFAQTTAPVISQTVPSTFSSLIHLLPLFLAAAWLCGFVVVLFIWCAHWRRVSTVVREAAPLQEGREVQALRRLESIGIIRKPVKLLLSRASLEPGIFGIARPVLVWPEGITARLEDAHLEAILTHEVWHVRRRDNLAAAIHMVVEAIFWFHPMVWWLGARLVEERERACDEEVLELGSERHVYAESILKICEFCVGLPLACVSGVTGADLKERIVHIMNESIARKLNFSKKLLLSAVGVLAIAVPVMFGLVRPTQSRAESPSASAAAITPGYESVSIKVNKTGEAMPPFKIVGKPVLAFGFKPGQFLATNATLHQLTRMVYGVRDGQVKGGPDWFDSEHYDVDVKVDKSAMDELQKLSEEQQIFEQKRMLQGLLADRFKLAFHREARDLPVYVLVIEQNGSKLRAAIPGDTYPNGIKRYDNGLPQGPGLWATKEGKLVGQGVPIASLIGWLSEQVGGRIVVDQTGLTGKYDFTLQLPTENPPARTEPPGSLRFTAMEEQLGLKLEPRTSSVEVLAIDRAEKPSEN